jgi:hypothetical protein
MRRNPFSPRNYYLQKLVASEADAIELMQKYAVHPPDTADGTQARGENIRTLTGVLATSTGADVPIRYNKMRNLVAYLLLEKGKKGQLVYNANEGGSCLYGTATYVPNNAYVPVYWLPWEDGGIISLTIPQQGSNNSPNPDPGLFFTAAINGCSVIITGNANNPRIFHGGGPTYKNTSAETAQFWHGLADRLTNRVIGGEANKNMYVAEDGVTFTDTSGRVLKTTQAAKDYHTWLDLNTSNDLTIEEVRPWGCVMGIRTANGNWKFYLQENASVEYTILRKKHGLFGPKVVEKEDRLGRNPQGKVKKVADPNTGAKIVVDRKRTVARPIAFSEIYPNAQRGPRIDLPMPKWWHG